MPSSLFKPSVDTRFPTFAAPLTPVGLPVARCPVSKEAASHRILIVRTIANGDILMSTPLIASLRAAWPEAHITYLVARREREAIEANPHVDRLLLWDTAYWKNMTRSGNYPLWFYRTRILRRLLHAERFETLISLMPEDWPWLVDAAGATKNIGVFDTFRVYHGQAATSPRARLYSDTFTFDQLPVHRTEQYLLPLRALGIEPLPNRQMVMGFTREDASAAQSFVHEQALSERFVIVAPRTGWPSRCWPEANWAEFADSLARQQACRILLVGSADDQPVLEAVATRMPNARPVIAAGTFGFRRLAALTALALLTASGDTGPMHVAAAVGTPFLALFGPTPVKNVFPLVGRGLPLLHPVPCAPCEQRRCPLKGAEHQQCLRLITVEQALEAAFHLLTSKPASR